MKLSKLLSQLSGLAILLVLVGVIDLGLISRDNANPIAVILLSIPAVILIVLLVDTTTN